LSSYEEVRVGVLKIEESEPEVLSIDSTALLNTIPVATLSNNKPFQETNTKQDWKEIQCRRKEKAQVLSLRTSTGHSVYSNNCKQYN
jgi:hypothetical protein